MATPSWASPLCRCWCTSMQMCWLLCDENLGRLTDCFLYQELEDAGRQRFAKCDVLPAVFFGENTKVAPKVALSLIHHLNCGSPSLSFGSALFSGLKLSTILRLCVCVCCVCRNYWWIEGLSHQANSSWTTKMFLKQTPMSLFVSSLSLLFPRFLRHVVQDIFCYICQVRMNFQLQRGQTQNCNFENCY